MMRFDLTVGQAAGLRACLCGRRRQSILTSRGKHFELREDADQTEPVCAGRSVRQLVGSSVSYTDIRVLAVVRWFGTASLLHGPPPLFASPVWLSFRLALSMDAPTASSVERVVNTKRPVMMPHSGPGRLTSTLTLGASVVCSCC